MSLLVRKANEWTIGRFRFTASGAVIKGRGRPSIQEWSDAIKQIRLAESAVQWWVGDLLNIGEGIDATTAAAVAAELGWSSETVRAYKWVCWRVKASNRVPTLSFSHHFHVGALASVSQRQWLARAEAGAWSAPRLRRELNASRRSGVAAYALMVEAFDQADRDAMFAAHRAAGRRVSKIERYAVPAPTDESGSLANAASRTTHFDHDAKEA